MQGITALASVNLHWCYNWGHDVWSLISMPSVYTSYIIEIDSIHAWYELIRSLEGSGGFNEDLCVLLWVNEQATNQHLHPIIYLMKYTLAFAYINASLNSIMLSYVSPTPSYVISQRASVREWNVLNSHARFFISKLMEISRVTEIWQSTYQSHRPGPKFLFFPCLCQPERWFSIHQRSHSYSYSEQSSWA